jgi:hypothetical protein
MLYQIHRVATFLLVLSTPVRALAGIPLILPVAIHANSVVAQTQSVPSNLKLDTTKPSAVVAAPVAKPDFDTEVLLPLKAAQAAKAQAEAAAQAQAAAAQAAAAKAQAPKVAPVIVSGDDAYAQVRNCEAGGDYTRNSGNGYYGAYQYNLGTWGNYGGYARPDLAPASVQDEKAHLDVARRGWSPWPSCARRAGLL